MAAFQALYLQAPFWIWIGIGCLFIAANLASGFGRLIWPAVAAVVVAAVDLAGFRPGPVIEAAAFALLWLAAAAVELARTPQPPGRSAPPRSSVETSAPTGALRPRHGAQLMGRIGRATCEFANGVGRVWIDGAEWAAELDIGEDPVPKGGPVRIVRVIGGVRLQVHPLRTDG